MGIHSKLMNLAVVFSDAPNLEIPTKSIEVMYGDTTIC
jgi:hypothetical protein